MGEHRAFSMERICCPGERQLEFVKQNNFIREAGTDGERKTADCLAEEIRGISPALTPVQEDFSYWDFVEEEASFAIAAPFEKEYPVKAYLHGESTPAEGVEAPFLYAGLGDEISLAKAKGAVVLLCEEAGETMSRRLREAGAVGFLSVSGTPLDQGEDRAPAVVRKRKCSLPGASIHYLDALELLEQGASRCRFAVRQKRIRRHSVNVRVRILGQELPEEIVTLSAHYDSVPEGPGAYDNCSGAAMVLEACRYFAEHPPKRTVEFIWFGAEEKGLLGSQAYVRAHGEELRNHIFNLNVDLAGQLIGGNVLGVTADASACRAIESLLKEQELPAAVKNQVWASDSNTFAWKGIPALTIDRDGFGMHTRHDTAALISPLALKQGAELLVSLAWWLANDMELGFKREIPAEMQEQLARMFRIKSALDEK